MARIARNESERTSAIAGSGALFAIRLSSRSQIAAPNVSPSSNMTIRQSSLSDLQLRLLEGRVIPAHPLALDSQRRLDERRQRALTRYYLDAGAGGIAVGVHTTQFEIRESGIDLLKPVLSLAAEEMKACERASGERLVKVAGIVGPTRQAVAEAELAARLGYDIGLVSLSALAEASNAELVAHLEEIAKILPIFGFYLQPAVGGRCLDYAFWRQAAEIDNLLAIKTAPFNRYQTLDVLRAVVEAGRAKEIALYTGNDDNILIDLLTRFRFSEGGEEITFSGGLLGQWAVWTRAAVGFLEEVKALRQTGSSISQDRLTAAQQLTDANAAIFDAANGFAGCIPGIHEILRRQGLLEGVWTLKPEERLSPGQADEIDRVCRAYPGLADDTFVRKNLERWLR